MESRASLKTQPLCTQAEAQGSPRGCWAGVGGPCPRVFPTFCYTGNPPPVEKLGNVAEQSRLAFGGNPRQHFGVCTLTFPETLRKRGLSRTGHAAPPPSLSAWGPCPQTPPPARERPQSNGCRQSQRTGPVPVSFWPRVVDLIHRRLSKPRRFELQARVPSQACGKALSRNSGFASLAGSRQFNPGA